MHARGLAMADAVLREVDAIPLGSQHTPWNASHTLRVRREAEQAVAALTL